VCDDLLVINFRYLHSSKALAPLLGSRDTYILSHLLSRAAIINLLSYVYHFRTSICTFSAADIAENGVERARRIATCPLTQQSLHQCEPQARISYLARTEVKDLMDGVEKSQVLWIVDGFSEQCSLISY
jgi:hypothetical protein